MGHGHPEQPARLSAIFDRLIASGLEMIVRQIDAPLATRAQLERVHEPHYVQSVFDRAPTDGLVMLDPDTAMGPHTLAAALRSAGAVVHAVDLVMNREFQAVFCAVRPPGHHAERDRAMGFCFFNNVAVGAAHALAAHGLERVAIVDFDVHHGNGTEHIFETEPRVLFCSSFQHPFYPFTGHETDTPHIVNITLPAGSDGARFREEVERHWLHRLHEFQPQLVLISAGFDAHAEDDMSHVRLREPDYIWITRELKKVADQYAGGRIVSTLEGGYNLSALGRSAVAHIDALLGH
ncbi:MAG: deacetylase [Gemmatimonadetes bacterium]|nr:deacetylase [Gemmatimonadota bacterium]